MGFGSKTLIAITAALCATEAAEGDIAETGRIEIAIDGASYECRYDPEARTSIARDIYRRHDDALGLDRISRREAVRRGLPQSGPVRYIDALPVTIDGREAVLRNVSLQPRNLGPRLCLGVSHFEDRDGDGLGKRSCSPGLSLGFGVSHKRAPLVENWCRIGGDALKLKTPVDRPTS